MGSASEELFAPVSVTVLTNHGRQPWGYTARGISRSVPSVRPFSLTTRLGSS